MAGADSSVGRVGVVKPDRAWAIVAEAGLIAAALAWETSEHGTPCNTPTRGRLSPRNTPGHMTLCHDRLRREEN